MALNSSLFLSAEINEIVQTSCSLNYYVFQNVSPYSPIPNEKGEAICLLNNDNVTASWNIIKPCEPSCLIQRCDNNQICAKATGETVDKCFCAGYVGKYCEIIDPQGFFFENFSFLLFVFLKKNKRM